MSHSVSSTGTRVEWVDLAKGLTILLVVTMHSTYNVEQYMGAEGWMHAVLAYATPFRMPVFFAVAGLFAAKAIARDWPRFIDSKFAHFLYFYLIWMTIQFIFKAPFFAQDFGVDGTLLYYIASYVQPFGLLWFIYLLPFYFLVLRLTQRVPMLAQFAFAIACKFALTHTGINIVDFFSKYYVFFLVGHFGRDIWFLLAQAARQHKVIAILGFSVWAILNGAVVFLGYEEMTAVAILMGALGFIAVVDLMAILPHGGPMGVFAVFLRFCGKRSLPIYLGFFLPMGVTRLAVPKLCELCGSGNVAFIVTISSIVGSLLMYEIVKRTGIGTFLYTRPQWARINGQKPQAAIPAE